MSALEVLLKPLHPALGNTIAMPARQSEHAAGFDLPACIDEPMTLQPGTRALIPCGFSMAFSQGFEAQVRPRSGLSFKAGLTVLNAPGTIDADYRGEVKAIMINLGEEPVTVEPGQRIAQLVFAAVAPVEVVVVTELDDTVRGSGGFGSTGT